MVRPVFTESVFEFFRYRLCVISCFQDQPLILFIITTANPHQSPFAFCFFAVENEMKLAFPQRFHRLLAVNVVIAAVPHHHRAAAILPLGNNAFEVFVFDRMIFHFYGKMFLTSLPRKSFR